MQAWTDISNCKVLNQLHTGYIHIAHKIKSYKISCKIQNIHQYENGLSTWLYLVIHILYCQTSNISATFVGNKFVDHSDVVGASPVLLQLHFHFWLNTWLQWIGQRQLQDERRIIQVVWFGAAYIRDFTVYINWYIIQNLERLPTWDEFLESRSSLSFSSFMAFMISSISSWDWKTITDT